MNPADEKAIREAISGIDKAMGALDADLKSLSEALDAGVSWEVASELRRCMFGATK